MEQGSIQNYDDHENNCQKKKRETTNIKARLPDGNCKEAGKDSERNKKTDKILRDGHFREQRVEGDEKEKEVVDNMYDLIRKIKKHWGYGLGRTALAAVCAHSVSISIGICQGYSAILLPQLKTSDTIDMNVEQSSWLASFGAVTNPIGAILSGLLAEWFGRKKSMQFSSLPFLIGWVCIATAEDISLLYTGRLITGIAAGMATASYTYVTEISTPKTRGIFQALGPVSASFGILLTYTLGYFLNWKMVAFISCAFSFFTLITVQLLPESPSYLYNVNKKDESFKSLLWLRRNNAVAMDELVSFKLARSSSERKDFRETYCNSKTLKPFAILVVFFLLQELSGIYSILFYAVDFFEDAKVNLDEHVSSIIVGAIRLMMSILGAVLINRFGRKSLCMVSSFGMSVTMFVIVSYFKYFEIINREAAWPTIPLLCVIANVLFSMIGMLPIPWILVGELFPTQVRSVMSGIVICLAQIFIFVSVKFYPDMIISIKFSGTCAVFLTASILAILFSKFILPETKNKTLEEIEHNMLKKNLFGIENKGFQSSDENLERSNGNRINVYTINMA